MCGIAGFVTSNSNKENSLKSLNSMLEHLKRRGPDGSGVFSLEKDRWNLFFGHRRLAIIDIEGGKQPLSTLDGSHHIVFNGEVYNFQKLFDGLINSTPTTRSDTEAVLLHLKENGPAAIKDFNGMFAFAFWDQKEGSLLLARDRSGIKPLYYTLDKDGGLAFSSQLDSILEYPNISKKINTQALASYFHLDYSASPESMIEGIHKLNPGEFLIWKDGSLIQPPKRFHEIQVENKFDSASPQQLWKVIESSVKRHLISDVPVGVFLSGGIDSSIVAVQAQALADQQLQTFSIAFEDAAFDESGYARQVAEQIKSKHFERKITESEVLNILTQALDALDEPMADPSLLPTYLLSELAAEHVKVSLGGDGGDELWAGYPTYKAYKLARIYSCLPDVLKKELLPALVSQLKSKDGYQSLEWKLKRFICRWQEDPINRHLNWMSSLEANEINQAFSVPIEIQKTWDRFHFSSEPDSIDGTDLNHILYLDYSSYMHNSVLTKVDRASMAHSLEARPPLLDNEMVEYAFGLNSNFKLNGLTTKYLLKEAARPYLPSNILDRPKKGFGIPLSRWLKTHLKEKMQNILNDSPVWSLQVLNQKSFQVWFQMHLESKKDYSKPLWALLVLDHWMKRLQIKG